MSKNVTSNIHNPLRRTPIALAVALSAAAVIPTIATAQESAMLEEVLVTARKRTESLQDVPISIQALGASRISELGITNFEDYAAMLPSLSYSSGAGGPGNAVIYMRGASDGGDGNSSGSQPSVGVYLDEQPITAVGSNMDLHIYDIERIEALAGPQGTLYGASSQSGTLRIITKKPNSEQFEAGFDLGFANTEDGDDSYSVEGFVNIPMGDKTALRLVGYSSEDGGWIDNVAGTRTYELEGGYGYWAPTPGGRQAMIDNDDLVGDDINKVETEGGRAALKIDLNENWAATLSGVYQKQETEGAFDHNNIDNDDYEISRFYQDSNEDEFKQLALTVEGEFANHSLIYSGGYMEREVTYIEDYTAYGEDAYWVPYYACEYYVDEGVCTNLATYYSEENDYDRQSHELRIQSLSDGRLHYTAGLYYEKGEHVYLQQWNMPGMSPALWTRGRENVYYTTDQTRESTQLAAFGELTFDFTDNLNGTIGVRAFDNEETQAGYTGYGVTNYSADSGITSDAKTDDQDQVYKVNLSWDATEDAMIYGTVSEGYRPGGINRDQDIPTPVYVADILTNYELGWKTTWMDGRMRWNGAAYFLDWDDMQYTVYQFSASVVANTYNVGQAEVKGFETDLTWLIGESFTLAAAYAYNDGETKDDYRILPTNPEPDIEAGTKLPNVPENKYNVSARYTFAIGQMDSYAQLAYSFVDESENNIVAAETVTQDSYKDLSFRAGLTSGRWGVDLYANNLTDENDNIFIAPRPYGYSTTMQRPRTVGIKFNMRFE
jgi:iron complex outermembrane receptor protein